MERRKGQTWQIELLNFLNNMVRFRLEYPFVSRKKNKINNRSFEILHDEARIKYLRFPCKISRQKSDGHAEDCKPKHQRRPQSRYNVCVFGGETHHGGNEGVKRKEDHGEDERSRNSEERVLRPNASWKSKVSAILKKTNICCCLLTPRLGQLWLGR